MNKTKCGHCGSPNDPIVGERGWCSVCEEEDVMCQYCLNFNEFCDQEPELDGQGFCMLNNPPVIKSITDTCDFYDDGGLRLGAGIILSIVDSTTENTEGAEND